MKSFNRLKKKAGLPPGSLIYTGEHTREKIRIGLTQYDQEKAIRTEDIRMGDLPEMIISGMVNWLSVEGLNDVDLIEQLGIRFNLHILMLEDVLNTEHLPKYEEFKDHLFFTLKILHKTDRQEEIPFQHISFVLGKDLLMVFTEKKTELFHPVQERIQQGLGKARGRGADYLLSLLLDKVIDQNYLVLEPIERDIEELELTILEEPSKVDTEKILRLRKNIISLKKFILPVRDELRRLIKSDSELIQEGTLQYLNDVNDHVMGLAGSLEAYRETLNGLMDLHQSNLSNKMNNVMMTLTIIATIFIPLTFIAGIYGMNFQYMPELTWKWGYPIVMGAILLIGVGMYIYIKKRRWF
ncbi:MAG: magnesium/cobalt transporter CorA [Bacteroidales bacterium]|nr:magnesium/cobalt transporter CorA [Bacteroidales bacterium]MCF8345133.1 magnesium/cobalt transporter CorA [Bacteroidales bacterium]MCF8351307.1 magnesium/cobalt transporter CorA [Bacteroidales bacterium]MCF8376895.1 magnesium/cobalt transporter CorA [Bacteroidales bacterium]MCF8400836.1 magnesium/cobalt transporter CorA [Bacteroidales bacterium]